MFLLSQNTNAIGIDNLGDQMNLTPQETMVAITEYGILVVIAALFLLLAIISIMILFNKMKSYDKEIVPVLEKVAESNVLLAQQWEKSAEEKRALADVMDRVTDTMKEQILVYRRAMEKAEKDDEFFLELREELQRNGLQIGEALALLRELHREKEGSKPVNQNVGPHV